MCLLADVKDQVKSSNLHCISLSILSAAHRVALHDLQCWLERPKPPIAASTFRLAMRITLRVNMGVIILALFALIHGNHFDPE